MCLLREERCDVLFVEHAHERADFAVEGRREAEQRHEIGQHRAALDRAHVALRDAARFGEHDLRETAPLSHLADARPEQFGSVRHYRGCGADAREVGRGDRGGDRGGGGCGGAMIVHELAEQAVHVWPIDAIEEALGRDAALVLPAIAGFAEAVNWPFPEERPQG